MGTKIAGRVRRSRTALGNFRHRKTTTNIFILLYLQHNISHMAILGHILGIIILILAIILVVGIFRSAVKFDFDAPIFRTDITITEKKEDEH